MPTQRGTVTMHVLETIARGALKTGDLITAFLVSPQGSSSGKLLKNMRQQERERQRKGLVLAERQRVAMCLSRLKAQGLIVQNRKEWKITFKGKGRLKQLKEHCYSSPPVIAYQEEQSNEVLIISFDIPENEKYKRDWLRRQLRELGFELLQKSVWIGKRRLPEQFLHELSRLNLLSKVHILAVTKTGTLHKI